jgi:hypothetical protein
MVDEIPSDRSIGRDLRFPGVCSGVEEQGLNDIARDLTIWMAARRISAR